MVAHGPMWTPLSLTPAFKVFRPDDSVVRALAGSQVALHEHRLAYNNLLAVANADRNEWGQQKAELVRVQGRGRGREATYNASTARVGECLATCAYLDGLQLGRARPAGTCRMNVRSCRDRIASLFETVHHHYQLP